MAPQSRPAGGGSKPPQAAVIKSHGGERYGKGRARPCQVRTRETNKSEPLMTCRKQKGDVKTGGIHCPGTSSAGTCLLAERHPAWRRREPGSGSLAQRGNLSFRCEGRNPSGGPTRMRVPMRNTGTDRLVVAMKDGNAFFAKGADYPARFGDQP